MKYLLALALLVRIGGFGLSAAEPGDLAPPEIQSIDMQSNGGTVTFTVIALGDELLYQWYWQGWELPGATNASLRFVDAYATANAGYYSVRVSNPAFPAGVYSAPYALLFTKSAPGGTYQGLVYDEDDPATGSAGYLQFKLTSSKQAFSGKIWLGKFAYPFAGSFSPAHDAEVTVPRADASPLRIQLQLLTLNDTPQLTGTVSDGTWTSEITGHRLYFSGKMPTPLAGKYTLSLQNTNASRSVPNGHGWATLVVRRNGAVAVKGQAPDGAVFSHGGSLSRNGFWPLYAAFPQGDGRLLGWMQISNQTTSSIQGSAAWLQAAVPEGAYPSGFTVTLSGAGSSYTAPPARPLLGFTNGVASFYAGDLFSNDTATWQFAKVLLRPPVTFRPLEGGQKVELKVNSKTGLVTGSFINLLSGQRSPVRAVVLQRQNLAPGFFLSSGASGAFVLSPGTSAP